MYNNVCIHQKSKRERMNKWQNTEGNEISSYLKIREAAKFLGISPNALRNWVKQGKVTSYRNPINNYCLFKKEDLAGLLKTITPLSE